MKKFIKPILIIISSLILVSLIFFTIYFYRQYQLTQSDKTSLTQQLDITNLELASLKSEDQYLINQDLEATISAVKDTFSNTLTTYEDLLDLQASGAKTSDLTSTFTQILSYLSKANYASASASLKKLADQIVAIQQTFTASNTPSQENLPQSNQPPGSGFSRQVVSTDVGQFTVSLIAADLNSTRVIVDTAADGDCSNNCPVLPLAVYVARNGAFAGVNGSYFCPASYPSCSGKANTFDTLLMNKNKVYFNSANNVYSTVPAAIFYGSTARFVGQSLEWGRDTGVDAVIANHPLLVSGGNVVFGGNSDPKQGSKGNRSFVGASGTTIYIGVVHSATVAESARVLHALGIQNALNLDSGGSTALFSGGYKVGPGRDIPNALLLVRK